MSGIISSLMIRTRYRRILWFFARLLLSLAYWELLLPKLGLRRLSQRTRPERLKQAAISFRLLAVAMGGVLIKVGQFLSSRVDVLPPEFTQELEGLQDEVPPVPFEAIRREIETSLAGKIDERFQSFDPAPLAAASLGQVHRASILVRSDEDVDERPDEAVETRLQTVVVKVLRPQIEKIIETDLAALKTVGGWLHRYRPIRKRADVPALLGEFRRVLFEEIDYLSEGRNAETFAVNFRDYPGVRVPQVYWTHTTRSVLTLEDVFAIKITDYEQISAAGVDRKEVASLLLDTYLKQIFEDGFFHADPHPGNLFVQPLDENAVRASAKRPWLLTFVDFGMTGRVPSTLRSGLRELLIGVGTRDSKRVLHAYQKMEMLLPNADLELLERASTRVFDQYWGKNMNELASIDYQEMRDLASEFRELIYEMPFQVPQNIIFLARCVGILSGMCTGLDPEFNLWSHLAPFARKIIAEESHQVQSTWLAEAEKLARTFLSLPHQIDNALVRLERGEISVRSPEISFQVRRLTQATRGLTSALVFAVLFLGGIQLFLAGYALLGGISAGLGALFLINAIATSRR